MLDGTQQGITVEFPGIDGGLLISLRRHIRSYQRTRSKGEDLTIPKLWLARGTITFPGWPRDLVLAAGNFAFGRMGPKFKTPRMVIREATPEELGHLEGGPPLPVPAVGGQGPDEVPLVHPPREVRETEGAVRMGQFGLLISKPVFESLSELSDAQKKPALAFLRSLTTGSWRSAVARPNGVALWISTQEDLRIYTSVVESIGTALWEYGVGPDLSSAIFPSGTMDGPVPQDSPTRPYVVLHEIRTSAPDEHSDLSFQEAFFRRQPGDTIDTPSRAISGVELSRFHQYYVLSPARMQELVDGLDVGLLPFLSEEQVAPFRSPRPILLSGEAGSGKSTVVVLWLLVNHIDHALKVADGRPLRQLFVTYSGRLRDKARQEFELMLPSRFRRHATEFRTFKEVLYGIITVAGSLGKYAQENESGFEWFVGKFARGRAPRNVDPVLLWDEIRSTIKGGSTDDPSKLIDFPAYEALSEKRGRTKTPQEYRKEYYEEAQRYKVHLQTEGRWDQLDLVAECLKAVGNGVAGENYDRIACDEVQDLAPAEIALLLKLLKNENVRNLLLTGDEAQVINPSGFSWARLKGELGARALPVPIPEVTRFRRNYRSSKEIVGLVNAILEVRGVLLDDGISRQTQEAVRATNVPPMLLCEVPLEVLRHSRTNPDERLVLVKTQEQKALIRDLLQDAANAVSILTVEEAKGLEWEGSLLYNFFVPRHEKITKNDWDAVFVPHLRAAFARSREMGERSPFGLTYEFNLLHVGTTRSKSFLAVYDEDKSLRLQGLGEPVMAAVKEADLDAFRTHWQTNAPSAADYRRLGERILERDSAQSRSFFRLAALEYQRANELQSAAECFEKAAQFEEAAECARASGDRAEELRFRARKAESEGHHPEAALHQKDRGDYFGRLQEREAAATAYAESARLFRLGKDLKSASQVLLLRAEVFPGGRGSDRAVCYEEAADALCEEEQVDACVEARLRALEEVDTAGVSQSSAVGVMPILPWRGRQHDHIAGHFAERGTWRDAATEARKASGYLRSASEQNTLAPSQKTVYAEASDAAAARSIDFWLKAKALADAGSARRTLWEFTTADSDLEERVIWWMGWIAHYKEQNLWEEFAEASTEIGSILSSRKDFVRSLHFLGAAWRACRESRQNSLTRRLLSETIRTADLGQDSQTRGRALLERARLSEEEQSIQQAFEDFRTSGRLLVGVGDLELARGALERAATAGSTLMSPHELGMFCIKEVAIPLFARNGLSEDAFDWSERGAALLAKGGPGAEKVLEEFIARLSTDVQFLRNEKEAALSEAARAEGKDREGAQVHVRDVERRMKGPLSDLAWHDVCVALIHEQLSRIDTKGDQLTRGSQVLDGAITLLQEAGSLEDVEVIRERTKAWHR